MKLKSRGFEISGIDPDIHGVSMDADGRFMIVGTSSSLDVSEITVSSLAGLIELRAAIDLAIKQATDGQGQSASAGQGDGGETLIDGDGDVWYRMECGNYTSGEGIECVPERHDGEGCAGYTRGYIQYAWGIKSE